MGVVRLLQIGRILAVFFIYHFPLNLLRYYLAGSAKKSTMVSSSRESSRRLTTQSCPYKPTYTRADLYASAPQYAPVQDELTNEPLSVISGTVPADLDGVFVRYMAINV